MDPLVKTQSHEDYSNGNVQENPHKRGGRRKTSIEYIENKSRRHATFSQRKSGIIKKAYELSTLTGTQILLVVASETGIIYTYTTCKHQPIVTEPQAEI